MKWIGLTGGIATGKTTVSKMIRDFGLPVVDADELARRVTQKNSRGLNLIVEKFGRQVLTGDGELDRKKLGQIIFQDEKMRLLLESVLHPLIQEERARERMALEQTGVEIAFYDVPLLFEKNLKNEFDAVVLVHSRPEVQRERIKERNKLSEAEIDARLSAQLPIDDKIKKSDYVIFNHGSLADLKSNVAAVIKEISLK